MSDLMKFESTATCLPMMTIQSSAVPQNIVFHDADGVEYARFDLSTTPPRLVVAEHVDMDRAARDFVAAINLILSSVGVPPVTPC